MKVWALTAATLLWFAGCSDPTRQPVADEDFSDLDVRVSASTGAIRGLVVDDRIVPVVGAAVALTNAERETTTDNQGRFVVNDLAPGTYFLRIRSNLHKEVQASAEVEAGVADPPLVRVQLERLFTQDPYSVIVAHDGFFECSQDGASWYYSSSTCVAGVLGPASSVEPLGSIGAQKREWHSDVPSGWQTMVFEMDWEPTSQGTSTRMGMVVSTYKPERSGSHWFAEFEGASPVRGQLDVGVEHESASGEEPSTVPAEGLQQMSYFVSVRAPDGAICPYLCVPPGLAVNQAFKVYLSQFVFGRPPDGWSLVNGDAPPF